MDYENILFAREGNIAILTINRPQSLNALNPQTMEEIESAVAAVAASADIRRRRQGVYCRRRHQRDGDDVRL